MTTIEGYDQRLPTEGEAVESLAVVLGPMMAEQMWTRAVRSLGLHRPVDSAADLRRVAEHLTETGGLAGAVARSLKIRINTYDALTGRAV